MEIPKEVPNILHVKTLQEACVVTAALDGSSRRGNCFILLLDFMEQGTSLTSIIHVTFKTLGKSKNWFKCLLRPVVAV